MMDHCPHSSASDCSQLLRQTITRAPSSFIGEETHATFSRDLNTATCLTRTTAERTTLTTTRHATTTNRNNSNNNNKYASYPDWRIPHMPIAGTTVVKDTFWQRINT